MPYITAIGSTQKLGGNRIVSNWTARHDAIVMDRINGMKNVEIAEKYNINQNYVSVICNSRQGLALLERAKKHVLEEALDNISDDTKRMILMARNRINSFLINDDLAERRPLEYTETTLKVAKYLGETDGSYNSGEGKGGSVTNIQVNVLESPEKRDNLAAGLEKARQVQLLHAGMTGESVDRSTQSDVITK